MDIIKFYERLSESKKEKQPFLIGIDGCGGSGKTTLAKQLGAISEQAFIIHIDDFYRPSAEQKNHEHEIGGMFDWQRLRDQVIVPVKKKQTGNYQRYDWVEDSLQEWHEVKPEGTVIIEGISAVRKELAPYYDVCIFVDTPYSVRLKRGVERDGEGMRDKWVNEWMPAEEQYVRAHKPQEYADWIIDGSGQNSDLSKGKIHIVKGWR